MFPGSNIVYKLMYVVGFALMMIINLKTYKRYKLNKIKTIILTLITYVAGVTGAMIMGDIYTKLMLSNGLNTGTNVAIFGAVIFTPLFLSIASVILKEDWRCVLDMLAPGIYLILACAKFGCFIYGCCYGLECDYGIKYLNNDVPVFPIQIVEVFLMSLIILLCFYYAFKSRHYKKGTVYPVTTIIYCIIRFFVEFFRYYEFDEQRHIILNMTLWQFCCVLMIIVSIIWIVILNSKIVKKHDAILEQKENELKAAEAKKDFVERARKNKQKQKKSKC